MMPAVAKAGLADAVDAFCESIAFTPAQTARVFEAARRFDLPVKLHAEQLTTLGGAQLAARFGALSADHLEHADEAGVQALAKAGVVAVLLPGAYYFLRETQKPPVRPAAPAQGRHRHRQRQQSRNVAAHVAAACDEHAATFFRLTVDECLLAVTREAARALGASIRSARSKPANGATSRSGTSNGPPSWSTASASRRCRPASGGAGKTKLRRIGLSR